MRYEDVHALALVRKIAQRAVREIGNDSLELDELDTQMDLMCLHVGECPLRLEELLKAPPFDFAHDILGIRRHLNRRTRKLMNHFWPRFAVPASERERARR